MDEIVADLRTLFENSYTPSHRLLLLDDAVRSFVLELPRKEERAPPKAPAPKKALSPLSIPKMDESMKRFYAKMVPHMVLHETPPQDNVAKGLKWASSTPLKGIAAPIFYSESNPFFTNLSAAITKSLAPSSAQEIGELEVEDLWGSLFALPAVKLLLISEVLLKNSPRLLSHFKQYPGKPGAYLDDKPVILLAHPTTYTLERKKILWGQISWNLSQ